MKNKFSPYLDIYKWETIVFKIWENVPENINLQEFLNYLNFLKQQNITAILLDKDGKELFKTTNNSFLLKEKIAEKIKNILIIEENNFIIKNYKWNQIEFISHKVLKKIISWECKKIKVEEKWLLDRLKEVDKILDNWNLKVTLTNYGWIKEELEWFGNWTMFINLDKARFRNLNNIEMFRQIYNFQIKNWNWKERTEEEIKTISKNYQVLGLEWTILWWYYLSDFKITINWENKKWILLENLFASKNGGWIGEMLWERIKSKKWTFFAYSKKWGFFKKLWFKQVEWIKSKTWADLYLYEK